MILLQCSNSLPFLKTYSQPSILSSTVQFDVAHSQHIGQGVSLMYFLPHTGTGGQYGWQPIQQRIKVKATVKAKQNIPSCWHAVTTVSHVVKSPCGSHVAAQPPRTVLTASLNTLQPSPLTTVHAYRGLQPSWLDDHRLQASSTQGQNHIRHTHNHLLHTFSATKATYKQHI